MKNKSIWHSLTVVACCGLTAASLGLIFNCIGVFYSPISTELGVGRGSVALFATCCALANGFCSPLFGKLLRRFPMRPILVTSILAAGLATMAMSQVESVWQLYILGVIQGVSVSCFASVPVTIIITNWFEQKHGMVTGIAFCFSGVGGAVFSPLFAMLISSEGWRTAFLLLGAAVLLFALPGALFILKLTPAERNLLPFGAEGQRAAAASDVARPATQHVSWLNSTFWLIAMLAIFASFCTALTQHLPGFAESMGLGAAAGAAMVSATMLGNVTSKLITGIVSDWVGPLRACLIMLTICLLALVLLLTFPTGTLFVALIAGYMFGYIYSVCSVGMPLVTRQVFGAEQYATVFPRITIVSSVGSSCAIAIIGYIYDFTRSYSAAFLCCVAFIVTCCTLLMILSHKRA